MFAENAGQASETLAQLINNVKRLFTVSSVFMTDVSQAFSQAADRLVLCVTVWGGGGCGRGVQRLTPCDHAA